MGNAMSLFSKFVRIFLEWLPYFFFSKGGESFILSDAMDYISWHCSGNGGKSKHQNWWLWQKCAAEITPFSH